MGERKFNPLVNNILFHYAKIDIFKSIIKNKIIWATDLSKTNDPLEINLGLNYINTVLSQIRMDRHSDDIKNMCEKIAGDLNGVVPITTFCTFCLSVDGDSIPMWNSYGDNYKGVSIGFHPAAFKDKLPIIKVEYIENDYVNFVKDSLLFISNHIIKNIKKDDFINYYMNISQFYGVILSAKDKAWSYEQEVRGVLPRLSPVDYENDLAPFHSFFPELSELQEKSWKKYESIRTEGHTLYTEIALGKHTTRNLDHSRSIKKIIVGPLCTYSIEEIKNVLIENGFSGVSVEKSQRRVR